MNLNPEIHQRIYEAADQLYAADGRSQQPTVDAVRKLARTNMNDTSTVMKAWRAERCKAPSTPAAMVPDTVRRVFDSALTELWGVAQSHANSALNAAQAGWEAERAESEAERLELSVAFDEQAAVLVDAQEMNAQLRRKVEDALGCTAEVNANLATAHDESIKLRSEAAALESRIDEQRSRIVDLKAEVEKSFSNSTRLQLDLDKVREVASFEAVRFERELAMEKAKVHRASDQENEIRAVNPTESEALFDAREAIIALHAQVEILLKQNAELITKQKPGKSSLGRASQAALPQSTQVKDLVRAQHGFCAMYL